MPSQHDFKQIGIIFNAFAICAIKFYMICLSPLLGSHCRFTPSCSTYALQAYRKYNFVKATALTFFRLAKCHPLHPGGYDPL